MASTLGHAMSVPSSSPVPPEVPALVMDGLRVALGGRLIIDGVSLRVGRGEFLCLCGPNGGGKTTVLKAALGLLVPQSGRVQVLGGSPTAARAQVGYLPQRKAFAADFPATPADLVIANLRGTWPLRQRADERERARTALARVGGESLLDRPLVSLSGGELQRAFLARALVNDPLLLLLDEPTAGVDSKGRADLLDLLAEVARRDDRAAVLVTHNLGAIRRLADRVIYLEQRIAFEGTPEAVMAQGLFDRDASGHDHVESASFVCEED